MKLINKKINGSLNVVCDRFFLFLFFLYLEYATILLHKGCTYTGFFAQKRIYECIGTILILTSFFDVYCTHKQNLLLFRYFSEGSLDSSVIILHSNCVNEGFLAAFDESFVQNSEKTNCCSIHWYFVTPNLGKWWR